MKEMSEEEKAFWEELRNSTPEEKAKRKAQWEEMKAAGLRDLGNDEL